MTCMHIEPQDYISPDFNNKIVADDTVDVDKKANIYNE
jgi:hypothetical protein